MLDKWGQADMLHRQSTAFGMNEKAQSTSFWRLRTIEGGMILSMALYYVAELGWPSYYLVSRGNGVSLLASSTYIL